MNGCSALKHTDVCNFSISINSELSQMGTPSNSVPFFHPFDPLSVDAILCHRYRLFILQPVHVCSLTFWDGGGETSSTQKKKSLILWRVEKGTNNHFRCTWGKMHARFCMVSPETPRDNLSNWIIALLPFCYGKNIIFTYTQSTATPKMAAPVL